MIAPTPAIVTQLAARRLPRWVMLCLVLLYVVPGFVGRDPWPNQELAQFGVMLQLAGSPEQWWAPRLLDLPAPEPGWLPYWLGAIAIQVLPGWPAHAAAQLPFAALLLLTLTSTWYAALHLARMPGAQPVALAFGGHAQPVDYARAMADAALLALVASLGLALLAHESAVHAARLAFAAVGLWAGTRALNPRVQRHGVSLLLWSASAWGLALSGSPGMALAMGLIIVACRLVNPHPAMPVGWLVSGFVLGALPSLALLAYEWDGSIALAWAGIADYWSTQSAWTRWVRLLTWFAWPTGFFALWAVWRWRRQWQSAHWLLPVAWVVLVAVQTVWQRGDDRTLLLALPALACLAAFALPTLKRSVTALVDWFAVVFFTGSAALIWLIWLAMQTGFPEQPARNVTRLFPFFQPTVEPWWLALAVGTSVLWIAVVRWRLGRHRPALWKSLVLSASGTVYCWVLLMSLWLPLLNHGMGLRPVAQRVAAAIPAGQCVAIHGLSQAQATALWYHGGRWVQRVQTLDTADCRWMVTTDVGLRASSADWHAHWTVQQRFARHRGNRDIWILLTRNPVPGGESVRSE